LKAREAIAKDIKQPYPFAKSTLLADANQIWYKIRDQVINADTTHQLNFAQCVENYCRLIDFTNETASQLWPDGRNSCIIVNPHHQFGQPVIDGTNTTAETMFLMFKSGDSIEALSKLYKLPTQKISDAIHFYQQRTAA
ncbi:DUF433 domain-containing protein, partial [bacterium]|nr:DUF433 domain-containing protein [bacterium]